MLNFTVGPVQMNENICEIGAEQVPYFRTLEFSKMMQENEEFILQFAGASHGARTVFLTGSGTAAMEAAVVNTLTNSDKVLVVNGGTFGERFVQLLNIYGIKYVEIKLNYGRALTQEELEKYDNQGFTAMLVNVHETSTGVHYDMNLISDFCKRNELFLIVDAISSFLADEFYMDKWSVDVMITGSQKALACPPGISILVLSQTAMKRIEMIETRCMYLDLKDALKNGERGQTPFTPAVGILRQIYARLSMIEKSGGVESEQKRIASLAKYFREGVKGLPFEFVAETMSNAVTALRPINVQAYSIFTILKEEYNIWVCPNGGELKDIMFRVGHIGNLTYEDYDVLLSALRDMHRRGLL